MMSVATPRVDRYTQVVLTVIALALCALVLRPWWTPSPAGALEPACGMYSTPCYVQTRPSMPLAVEVKAR